MDLKPRKTLVDMVKKNEGFSPKLTDDVGHPMIGYGCHLSPTEAAKYKDKTITESEAEALLVSRLIPAMQFVERTVKVKLTENQFDALSDFVYNVGAGNFYTSTLLKKLSQEDYAGAAEEFKKWNMAAGKVLPGLTARREQERKLFLS